MQSRASGLQRSASRWAFQVSASLGATLIAALIVQALPRVVPDAPPPLPELTSGGKFAARVVSLAYDGLDTMPLPHVEAPATGRPPVVPAAFLAASPTDPVGFGALPATDGAAPREHIKAPRGVRVPSRVEVRRLRALSDAPATVDLRDATSPAPAGSEASDDGLLHQVVTRGRQIWTGTSATTRDAWSATASVGSSLVSRLIP